MPKLNATKRSDLVDGPVRRIGVQSRSITGTLPGGQRYESTLERDFLLLMEFDPLVDVCTPQPLTLPWRDRTGRWHRYTPDFLVEYRKDLWMSDRRPWLVEIKYREAFAGQAWQALARYRAARAYAREQGWRFSICTEDQIRTPYLDNARFLLGYRKRNTSVPTERRIRDRLCELGEATPRSLMESLSSDPWEQAALVPVLWKLIALREIGCDVISPLAMDSRIWTLRDTDA